jgi:hypothetical protein
MAALTFRTSGNPFGFSPGFWRPETPAPPLPAWVPSSIDEQFAWAWRNAVVPNVNIDPTAVGAAILQVATYSGAPLPEQYYCDHLVQSLLGRFKVLQAA